MARRKRSKNRGPRPGAQPSAAPVEPDEPAEPPLERRTLLELGLSACGLAYMGAIGYPIYRYLASPGEHAGDVEAGAVHELLLAESDLPEVGAGLVFRFGARPAILIRHGEHDFVCLDAVCTHMGCTVRYEPEKSRIHCACHGGTFDPATGANVKGPPPRPLERYQVEVRADGVVISRS